MGAYITFYVYWNSFATFISIFTTGSKNNPFVQDILNQQALLMYEFINPLLDGKHAGLCHPPSNMDKSKLNVAGKVAGCSDTSVQ